MKRCLSAILLIIFCSCSKDTASTTNNNIDTSPMSADINGVHWSTNNVQLIKNSNGIVTAIVGKAATGDSIGLYLNSGFAEGSYSFRPQGVDSAIVLFSSLSGTIDNGNVLITWSTSQENNLLSFAIERSYDGVNFTVIGNVAAKGNTSSITNYSFIDVSHANGIIYYRIKAVSHTGSIMYTQIVKVSFNYKYIYGAYNSFIGYDGTINVTTSDTASHLYNGTFYFVCTNSSGNAVQVRNGRFNIHD